jgi:hypothetical protein
MTALDEAQRPVPLHFGCAEFGIGGRWQIAERAVQPDGVVVVPPERRCLVACANEVNSVSFNSSLRSHYRFRSSAPSQPSRASVA